MNRVRLALLLATLITLGWFAWQPQSSKTPVAELPGELAGQPDLYMLDAQITQFSADGDVKYILESKNIRHFEQDGMTRLATPKLQLSTQPDTIPNATAGQPEAAPWIITAKQGFIRRTPDDKGNFEEVVFLRESVQLSQMRKDGSFMRLRTPSLYVYPDREFARSSDDVTIDTEAGRTKGGGMDVDLSRSILNVSSQPPKRVQTIILPDQFK